MLLFGSANALTPIEDKNVPINRAENLVREAPERFVPHELDEAPKSLDYRMYVLPFTGDRYSSDQYIVVPTIGLVAPIQFGSESDKELFTQ